MSARLVDVLIAGAGLAGARTAEGLRALGFDGRILLAGAESHAPYERPALSKAFLLGERSPAELPLRPPGFWDDHAIDLRPRAAVVAVDVAGRRAVVGARAVRWRRLVLATGVRARRLPGLDGLAGIHHLRTMDEAARLRDALVPGARLVIVGAGFIGFEVASTARRLGLEVTVVDVAPVPFAATLGPGVGARMAALAGGAGVRLLLGRGIARPIAAGGRLVGLELDDGARLACDAAVVGVGSRPNAELAAGQLPLAADGGVVVDAAGRTSAPHVFACGDVASGPAHGRVEHWSAAAAGGRAVAHAVVGAPTPPAPPAYFWTDQFARRLQVVGVPPPRLDPELEVEDDGRFVARYRAADGRLAAVALLDRPELLPAARAELAGAAAPLALA